MKYRTLWKFAQREEGYSMRKKQTDMAKLIVALRSSAQAFKKVNI